MAGDDGVPAEEHIEKADVPVGDDRAGDPGKETREKPTAQATPTTPTAPKAELADEPTVVELDNQTVDVGDVARESRNLADLLASGGHGPAHGVDVLLVAALEKERDALRQAFRAERWRNPDGSRSELDLWRATVTGKVRYDVAILMGTGAGLYGTMLAIDSALRELAPRLVILVGIAAGKPGAVKLGDLVVSTGVVAIVHEKRGLDDLTERRISVNAGLVQQIRTFAKVAEVRLVAGTIVAANAVVRDAQYRDHLLARDSKAVAIEMEGGALAAACERNYLLGARFVVLKAIVDFADSRKSDEAHEKGCTSAADFVYRFLEDGPLAPERSPGPRRAQKAKEPADGGPALLPGRRVPPSALAEGVRTFVPPPAYGAAEATLGAHGAVVLAGPRHSGRGTAARRLLSAARQEVYELDETVSSAELARTALVKGMGYILHADARRDLGTAVRSLVERAKDEEAGLVICAPPGRSEVAVSCPDLVVEWHFLAGDPLLEAVGRHLLLRSDVTWHDRAKEMLANDEICQGVLAVRSTREMAEAVSLLRRAAEEQWPTGSIVGSLGSAGRAAICERIRQIDDIRGQAWFLAVAVLGPASDEDATLLAEDLSARLAERWPSPAPTGSPFGGSSRRELLERIDARPTANSAGRDVYSIPGVDGATTLSTVWAEFGQLRPVLTQWFVSAGHTVSVEGLHPVVMSVARLVLIDQEAGLGVIRSWAARFVARSLFLTEAVFSQAIRLGAGEAAMVEVLRRWVDDEDLHVAVTATLALGGLVGRVAPEEAVGLLTQVVAAEVSGSVRHRIAIAALALLLTTAEGSKEVIAFLARNTEDVCSTPSLKRTQLHVRKVEEIVQLLIAVDPVLVLARERTPADGDGLRGELAPLLADLLGNSLASPDVSSALRLWARARRSDKQWTGWLGDLLADIVAVGENYRARTAVDTLLRRLGSDRKNRAIVAMLRARLSASTVVLVGASGETI